MLQINVNELKSYRLIGIFLYSLISFSYFSQVFQRWLHSFFQFFLQLWVQIINPHFSYSFHDNGWLNENSIMITAYKDIGITFYEYLCELQCSCYSPLINKQIERFLKNKRCEKYFMYWHNKKLCQSNQWKANLCALMAQYYIKMHVWGRYVKNWGYIDQIKVGVDEAMFEQNKQKIFNFCTSFQK